MRSWLLFTIRTLCLSTWTGLKCGSKSSLSGSTLIGLCLLPLLQSDHWGLIRPQKDGPVKTKENRINRKLCQSANSSTIFFNSILSFALAWALSNKRRAFSQKTFYFSAKLFINKITCRYQVFQKRSKIVFLQRALSPFEKRTRKKSALLTN